MKLGVLLPSFAQTPDRAIALAQQADEAGVHGVFVYDHIWPMGQPGRPAISAYPLLGMISELTTSVMLGTLVARVGLVPDDVLVRELLTLHRVTDSRMIAGLGTGDTKSAEENLAYGIAFAPPDERRATLRLVAMSLLDEGVPVWIGGGSTLTNAIARGTGAVLNLWGASKEVVAAHVQTGPVSWGGALPKDPYDAARCLSDLRDAGATWAVVAPPDSIESVLRAASRADLVLGVKKA